MSCYTGSWLQASEEYARAVTMASSYCSLVDSMLSTAEVQAAGVEQFGRPQLNVPELLELRLQDVASAACASSLRELEQASTAALYSTPPGAGTAAATVQSIYWTESLLEVQRALSLPESVSRRLAGSSIVTAPSRRMLTQSQADLVAQARAAARPARTLAGGNEVCRK